jgi:hypothetical protein
MNFPNSVDLIKKVEQKRQAKVICYLTSDRKPPNLFPTRIANDIYTPWPLVNLIREFCEEFEVIIPRDARSAATLIALGANRIIMSPLSHLSPVDPEGIFSIEGKTQRIEVENILGFLDFAREKIGLNEQESLTETLKELTKEVKPTILGSINRTHSLIRRLSENLLKLHIKDINNETQINQIVENLTQKLFSHQHSIGRKEAKDILGFNEIIEYADDEIWQVNDDLLKIYFDFMEENSIFKPIDLLDGKNEAQYKANRGVIDSVYFTNIYEGHYKIKKEADHQITINTTFQGWKQYEREG